MHRRVWLVPYVEAIKTAIKPRECGSRPVKARDKSKKIARTIVQSVSSHVYRYSVVGVEVRTKITLCEHVICVNKHFKFHSQHRDFTMHALARVRLRCLQARFSTAHITRVCALHTQTQHSNVESKYAEKLNQRAQE